MGKNPTDRGKKGTKKNKQPSVATVDRPSDWGLSPFRVLLYLAFCVLSMQATSSSLTGVPASFLTTDQDPCNPVAGKNWSLAG